LFAAERILQEQWSQSRETVLVSIHDKDDFCSSTTDEDRRTGHRTKLFVVARILTKVLTQKLPLGSSLGADVGFRDISPQ
jgi:hypothetical protein